MIRRDEYDNNWGAGDPHEAWYRLAGREIGYTGNNGSDNQRADYAITERQAAPYGGAFRQGQTAGALHRDFVGSYEALNSYQQGSSAGNYTASQSGETLRSVALALWGDASLWYKLAEANGLQADTALVEGQRLALPAGVARNHYNAQTLKPYDAEKTLGDVSPTPVTPKPAKKNKCGVFGQILLAVVAIAVTAIAPFGSASIGAVMGNAAAGSVASQSLGVVTGIQDKFSFGAVALSAVGGGLGAGLSGSFGSIAGSPFLGDVARGALGSAVTQGIGVATGLQDNFSWAGVAAAGIGSGVFAGAARELGVKPLVGPGSSRSIGNIARTVAASTASLMASAATRSAIEGTSFGDNIRRGLPDAIGYTVGSLMAGGITGRGSSKDDIVVSQDAIDRAISNLPSLVPSIDLDAGLSLDTKLALGEVSGTLTSREAATIRAMRDDMATEIVMGQNLAAAGQGQEGRFQSGAFDKHYGSVSSYSLSRFELRGRQADFDAFVATLGSNPSSKQLADISNYRLSLQGDEANLNAALAIADRNIVDIMGSVYGGVDFAKGSWRLAHGEVNLENGLSVGLGFAGVLGTGKGIVSSIGRALAEGSEVATTFRTIHKNSLDYIGDTHVYVIRNPDGTLYKVGESAQGVRVGDGASIRAEQQARALQRETGNRYRTQIRQDFGGKADARAYETRFIQTYERLFGQRPPGNPFDR